MDFIKSHWNLIATLATWIMGIIGAFFFAPPVAQEEGLSYFARFVVTVLVGILLVGTWIWNRRADGLYWLIGTLALLIIGIACYFYNLHLVTTHVVMYNGKHHVIGDEFTPQAKKWCKEQYKIPCEEVSRQDLVMDYGGKFNRIWTQQSVDWVELKLAMTYVLILPVFAAAIMSTIQMMSCFSQIRPP